jgi:hypothetical protein
MACVSRICGYLLLLAQVWDYVAPPIAISVENSLRRYRFQMSTLVVQYPMYSYHPLPEVGVQPKATANFCSYISHGSQVGKIALRIARADNLPVSKGDPPHQRPRGLQSKSYESSY